MFKFMKGKGHNATAERAKLQKDLFEFTKSASYGFPHRPTALAWDPHLLLMAIGTQSGAVKICGQPGVEFRSQHKNECAAVVQLFFVPSEGHLISHCADNSLHLWELNKKNTHWELDEVKSVSLEGQMKRITTCCLHSNSDTLLIGTVCGNVYTLDVKKFEISEDVIYQDVVLQNVSDDYKISPGAVEAIAEHPKFSHKLLIGYNCGLQICWDTKDLTTENVFMANQQLEYLTWHRGGAQFISAHNDGSYIIWSTSDPSKPLEVPTTPYGPYACKAIQKILWQSVKSSDDFLIFSGGMPRASHGERNTVTVMNGEKHQVLDFTSKVVDFFLISDPEDESDFDNPQSLVVLTEEELVVLDLENEGWLPFQLPYLASLHSSAITCAHHCTDVPQQLWNQIVNSGKKQSSGKFTDKEWPITGGKNLADHSSLDLLITGHEDGSVKFWCISGVALRHLYTVSTSNIFVTEDHEGSTVEDGEEWPPIRKVGVFDPYSDDPRLAVKKIALCLITGTLVIGGTAGQVVLLQMKDDEIQLKAEAVEVNLVKDNDNFAWKGHDKLSPRRDIQKVDAGFQPACIMQLSPPAAVSALAVLPLWNLLAAGTAHGFVLFDYMQKKCVMSKCTLNITDLSETSDNTTARHKSFKKSLRESFRRLRKRKSQQRSKALQNKEDEKEGSKEAYLHKDPVPVDMQTPPASASPHPETKPIERQVEERATDDSLGSMVRCLYFAQSFIVSSLITVPTLWAGTNSGTVFIFTISLPTVEERMVGSVTCQLAKEIQLKHQAPVLAIQIMDHRGYPLPDPLDVQHQRAKPADLSGSHRVIICSEEQFKVFTLPNLKPYCKYKLTAHEGSKVRKVGFSSFTIKNEKYVEYCMVCLTNMGDVSIYSIPDLRRQLIHPCIKQENINGISSVVFTTQGSGFYLCSPSEFECFSVSASNIIEPVCEVELPENARIQIPFENGVASEIMERQGGQIAAGERDHAGIQERHSEAVKLNDCSQEGKRELDTTVDSVKDHIGEQPVVTVVEHEESTVVRREETVITITSMSHTSEPPVVSSEAEDQPSSNLSQEEVPPSTHSTPVPQSSTPNEIKKAPLADIEEFRHIDDDEGS